MDKYNLYIWWLWTAGIIKEKNMQWSTWTDHTIHYMKKSFLQQILFQETPSELMKLIEVMRFTRNQNLHQISQNVHCSLSFGLLYWLLSGEFIKFKHVLLCLTDERNIVTWAVKTLLSLISFGAGPTSNPFVHILKEKWIIPEILDITKLLCIYFQHWDWRICRIRKHTSAMLPIPISKPRYWNRLISAAIAKLIAPALFWKSLNRLKAGSVFSFQIRGMVV